MRSETKTRHIPTEVVTRCWCSKCQRRFGLVFERKAGEVWELQHSYLVNESYEEAECEQVRITGSFGIEESYNGCKWCGAKDIFQCGECQAFCCKGSRFKKIVKCGRCRATLILSGTVRSFMSSVD